MLQPFLSLPPLYPPVPAFSIPLYEGYQALSQLTNPDPLHRLWQISALNCIYLVLPLIRPWPQ